MASIGSTTRPALPAGSTGAKHEMAITAGYRLWR